MSDSLLPAGIRIESGRDLDERPVIVARMKLVGEEELSIVIQPWEAAPLEAWLSKQPDRRVKALGALLLRQARLIEAAERASGRFPYLVGR